MTGGRRREWGTGEGCRAGGEIGVVGIEGVCVCVCRVFAPRTRGERGGG